MKTSENIKIRNATHNDINKILEIYSYYVLNSVATFDEKSPSLAEMKQNMQDIINNSLPYIVIEDNEILVGYAYLTKFSPRGSYKFTAVNSIFIDHNKLHNGYGELLMNKLINQASNTKIRNIIARISNPKSIKFHKKFGFKKVGLLENVGFKFNKWIDVTIMQLQIENNE